MAIDCDEGWYKAKASGGGSCCVEVRIGSTTVGIRDSKYRGTLEQRPVIEVPLAEWRQCLASLAAQPGHFRGRHLVIERCRADRTEFRAGSTTLVFHDREVAAFLDGVANHEFHVVAEHGADLM